MDYQKLQAALSADASKGAVVNSPFTQPTEAALLFLGICVLLVRNPSTNTIDRVALSNTELAHNTTTVTAIPFHDIKIPADHTENIVALAISSGQPQQTSDWNDLFTPALTPDEARLNQTSATIDYSAVYPLVDHNAALIFSYYYHDASVALQQADFMRRYTDLVNRQVAV